MAVKPIPDGYHAVTPYLLAENAQNLIEFLKRAFDAREVHVMKSPNGRVAHAELKIGDSILMLGEPVAPRKPKPASFYLYVPDTDAVYKKALAAGAVSTMEPEDKFYGDRNAGVQDAEGNEWWIATHIKDVSLEELETLAVQHAK